MTLDDVLRCAKRPITIALNFLRQRTPESSVRFCAVACCLTGCYCAKRTIDYAFAALAATPADGHAATVTACVGVTSALIASGCVAILARTKDSDFKDGTP